MNGNNVTWQALIFMFFLCGAVYWAGAYFHGDWRTTKNPTVHQEESGIDSDLQHVSSMKILVDRKWLCIPDECYCFDVMKMSQGKFERNYDVFEHFHF